jgi:pimeloyl-ACP methyl ester carboxylesterase
MLSLLFAAILGLHMHPCALGTMHVAARCGTYGVYENRAARSGRIIALHVVVIPALHSSHRAIAEIAGGPGEATTAYAPFILSPGAPKPTRDLHDTYDLLFMDDRGMGQSNQLQCPLAPPADPAVYFAQLFPDGVVRSCRDRLSRTSRLALYDTDNATDDLDDLRAALGYRKLVLDGGSYGTFFSLIYMRRHPEHVESAVLNAVAPPHFQPLPGEPMGAQRALDDLAVKCKRDASCNAHFPHFAQYFQELVDRLGRGPVPVRLIRGKSTVAVMLSKEVFVDRIRELLYDPQGASYLPYAIERAHANDTVPLATLVNSVSTGLDEDLSMGAYLSYSCAEFIPFLDERAVTQAAAHSFAGDLRISAQRHACAIWNVPAMPAAFNDPVHSNAPVLMLSGSDDPATPAQYARAAAAYLPNARIVFVRGAGHGVDTPCSEALVERFVRAQSAAGLDVDACSATFKLPPFATSMAGFGN